MTTDPSTADPRLPGMIQCSACNGIGEQWVSASTAVPCHCSGGFEPVSPEPGPAEVRFDVMAFLLGRSGPVGEVAP